ILLAIPVTRAYRPQPPSPPGKPIISSTLRLPSLPHLIRAILIHHRPPRLPRIHQHVHLITHPRLPPQLCILTPNLPPLVPPRPRIATRIGHVIRPRFPPHPPRPRNSSRHRHPMLHQPPHPQRHHPQLVQKNRHDPVPESSPQNQKSDARGNRPLPAYPR